MYIQLFFLNFFVNAAFADNRIDADSPFNATKGNLPKELDSGSYTILSIISYVLFVSAIVCLIGGFRYWKCGEHTKSVRMFLAIGAIIVTYISAHFAMS